MTAQPDRRIETGLGTTEITRTYQTLQHPSVLQKGVKMKPGQRARVRDTGERKTLSGGCKSHTSMSEGNHYV